MQIKYEFVATNKICTHKIIIWGNNLLIFSFNAMFRTLYFALFYCCFSLRRLSCVSPPSWRTGLSCIPVLSSSSCSLCSFRPTSTFLNKLHGFAPSTENNCLLFSDQHVILLNVVIDHMRKEMMAEFLSLTNSKMTQILTKCWVYYFCVTRCWKALAYVKIRSPL